VLLKIGWPKLVLPTVARPLFRWASPRWNGIGEAVEAEFFPNTQWRDMAHIRLERDDSYVANAIARRGGAIPARRRQSCRSAEIGAAEIVKERSS
jgi:hypothetical protein